LSKGTVYPELPKGGKKNTYPQEGVFPQSLRPVTRGKNEGKKKREWLQKLAKKEGLCLSIGKDQKKPRRAEKKTPELNGGLGKEKRRKQQRTLKILRETLSVRRTKKRKETLNVGKGRPKKGGPGRWPI